MRTVTSTITADVLSTVARIAVNDGLPPEGWVAVSVVSWAATAPRVNTTPLPPMARDAIKELHDHAADRRPLDLYLYLLDEAHWPIKLAAEVLGEPQPRVRARVRRGRAIFAEPHDRLEEWLWGLPPVPISSDLGGVTGDQVPVQVKLPEALYDVFMRKVTALDWPVSRALTTAAAEELYRRGLDAAGRPTPELIGPSPYKSSGS